MRINKVKMIYHGIHVDLKRDKIYDKRNFLTILIKLLKSIFSLKLYSLAFFKQKHFFFFNTKNQFEALKYIYNELNISSIAYYHGYDLSLDSNKYLRKYPFWISYLFSLVAYFYDYQLISNINKKLSFQNRNTSIKYVSSIILGHYYLNKIILSLSNPKYLWLSNDHSYNNVAFLFASKELLIPSIYIQHASVSPIFPSLRFDYAFLDGRIAYNTYKKIGICGTKVFLYGIPKMDGWINRYTPDIPILKILICVNNIDDFQKFEKLIDLLLQRKYEIYLRKHPYVNYNFLNEDKVELLNQNTFMETLNGIDLMIGGDSNVHLEAAITNVPSIYFSTSHLWDYYGFLKMGLISYASTDENEIVSIIENYSDRDEVYYRAKEFCESIGTDYQNKSRKKIVNEVNNF